MLPFLVLFSHSPAAMYPLNSLSLGSAMIFRRWLPYSKVGQPFQNGGQVRLSRAARGPELQTKTQHEDAYYYNIFIANQRDGWCCLPWRRISMSGSMDELDKSRMSFRWRSERRERRRDFVYIILEKGCSQQ